MVKVQEIYAFGQTIVAVLDGEKIISLRKGEAGNHEKNCARYHAKKQRQGTIVVERINSYNLILKTVEVTHDDY